MPDEEVWVYHERQDALLCGQHALNNLVQAAVFSPDQLADIAHQLDAMELNYMAQNNEGGVTSKDYLRRAAEESGNVDSSGNFSIEVLRSALLTRYNVSLPNIRQEGVIGDGRDVTDLEGFICNKDSHWFAIRKINGRFWNLNSTFERPEQISHFRLAAEIEALQKGGYSVFCVTDHHRLPEPCTSSVELQRGLPQYWWKEDDLVKAKSDATTGATNPWRNVGEGVRLDGKPTTPRTQSELTTTTTAAAGSSSNMHIDGLSEEEMLQMALAASLENEEEISRPQVATAVRLKPEPSAADPNAVRIQIRLPDGNRVVRRFLSTDVVDLLYAFVEDRCKENGRLIELRAGFPPKDLRTRRSDTIGDAQLGGQSVQVRYL